MVLTVDFQCSAMLAELSWRVDVDDVGEALVMDVMSRSG